MTTNNFLKILNDHPNLPLIFEYQKGAYTRMDYHITEIKNIQFDTVDCGGVQNQWKEVHIQLWENELPEPNHRVSTTKALDIFTVVEKVRATYGEVDIKFEYGNAHFHKAVLPVQNILIHEQQIIVQLGKDQVCCKAKDRAVGAAEEAAACCGPAIATSSEPIVNLAELFTESKDVCTPGGGCC